MADHGRAKPHNLEDNPGTTAFKFPNNWLRLRNKTCKSLKLFGGYLRNLESKKYKFRPSEFNTKYCLK